MRRLARLVVCLATFAAGCDDDPEPLGPPEPDASADAGLDHGPSPDASIDAMPDAALDARADAVPDASADASRDDAEPADIDAARDAASPDDGAVDGATDGSLDAAPDLQPDMPWAPAAHRVFMTADSFTADFGGLDGADAACAAAAAGAGLDGVWRAIISDAETGARDRLIIVGPIETTAGERVAQGVDDLWDGAIRVPIAVDARGLPPGGRPDVWTGTDADGRPDARANSFCSDWGRADRPLGGVEIGRGDLNDGRWVALYRDGASAFNCGSEARLYCIDGQ